MSAVMSAPLMELAEPRPITWDKAQYHQMGELGWFDDIPVELVEGEIIQMSPISSPHWKSVILTGTALRQVFGSGYVVAEQNAFDGGLRSEPQPDVAVYEGEVRDFEALPSHALLIVEVSLSTLRYDRARKAGVYAHADIAEYWIVNVAERVLEVHRQPSTRTGSYEERWTLDADASVSPLAAPECVLKVADFLP